MSEMDPRLKKFSITLINSLRTSKIKKKPTNKDTVLNLWPSLTLKEVLKNRLFYKHPITQPPTLTPRQFLRSLKSKNVSSEFINNISLVNVDYRGFDNLIYHGQVIIHNDLVSSLRKVFKRILLETNYPMTSVFPISMFNWNSSSICNNCGAFDWRFVDRSDEISDHTFGAAMDINPVINPWMRKGLPNSPNHPYDKNKRGALQANSKVVQIFKEEGWKWGGDWKYSKDRMHFYRPEIPYKYYGKVEVED